MKPSVTAVEDDGRMRGRFGGGDAGCLAEVGETAGLELCVVECVCVCVLVKGGLTQSDATLIGGNGEVCLNRRDRREMNSCYDLWFCSFTDEAHKGIKQSSKHKQTCRRTHTHTDQQWRKDSKLCLLSPFQMSTLLRKCTVKKKDLFLPAVPPFQTRHLEHFHVRISIKVTGLELSNMQTGDRFR